MKKKLLLLIVLFALLLIGVILIINKDKIFTSKVQKMNNQIKENNFIYLKTENGVIIDKENDYIIYDSNIKYDNKMPDDILVPEKIEYSYISEYLKYFFSVFPEQSFPGFNKEEIAIVVSLASDLFEPRTTEYVQEIARRYFGINNYELPTGTYILENYGNYTVQKTDNYYYRSSVANFTEFKENSVFMTNFEVDQNKIRINYDYASDGLLNRGCYTPLEEEHDIQCIIGTYEVELTHIGDRINIDKIEYNKNPLHKD